MKKLRITYTRPGSRDGGDVADATACIALLRGVNVGRAKRIAMADLRALIEDLGFTDTRTLLNSGNAVFRAARPDVAKIATAIEAGIRVRCGFSAAVVVVTAGDLDAIIEENALHHIAADPSRYLVAFVAAPTALQQMQALSKLAWAPEAVAIGRKAAYVWCAGGIADSKVVQAVARATAEGVTTRNWATVLKLQTLARAGGNHVSRT
jgi:uncharacterized protein (DUF1697 family)